MRCFLHTVRQVIYVSPQMDLLCGWTLPSNPQVYSQQHVHLYTSYLPEHSLFRREYRLVSIPWNLFARYLSEISLQEACAIDARLIDFVARRQTGPDLLRLRSLLPPGSRLRGIEVRRTREGTLFEFYLSAQSGERGIRLTSAIAEAHLLPTYRRDGRPLLLAPTAGKQGGGLLALALAVSLWGENECVTYPFEME